MKRLLAAFVGLAMLVGFAQPAGCLMGYINRQTIIVYDYIQHGDEVEIRTLFDGQEKEYQIIINSLGGRGFVCMSIVNHIKSLQEAGAKITTEVSGVAASAGAILWLMGDVRVIHKTDLIMFHGIQFYNKVTGELMPESEIDADDKMIRDHLNNFMISELAKHIGQKEAKKMVKGDHWFTGQQAYDMGLATILK